MMRELLPHLAPRCCRSHQRRKSVAKPQWLETQSAAARGGIVLIPFEIRSPEQFQQAFDAFTQGQAEALLVPPDVTFFTHQRRIADLAAAARLPSSAANLSTRAV